MEAYEFETHLEGGAVKVPEKVLKSVRPDSYARVILLVQGDTEDRDWKNASFRQFLNDDSEKDSAYDALI